jgi:hypothetical protein
MVAIITPNRRLSEGPSGRQRGTRIGDVIAEDAINALRSPTLSTARVYPAPTHGIRVALLRLPPNRPRSAARIATPSCGA